MYQTVFEKHKNIKTIVLLSIASLILKILTCVTYFVNYNTVYNDGNFYTELVLEIPSLYNLFYLLLNISPQILFILYLLNFYKKCHATIFWTISFGIESCLLLLLPCITVNHLSFVTLFAGFICLPYGVAIISALRGFPKKIFLIIAVTEGIFFELFQLHNNINIIVNHLIKEGQYLYIFTYIISPLGTMVFYITLLLFALKNNITAILPINEKKIYEKMNPEQALRVLKDKFDTGVIDEEEYQTQRAEIINKL